MWGFVRFAEDAPPIPSAMAAWKNPWDRETRKQYFSFGDSAGRLRAYIRVWVRQAFRITMITAFQVARLLKENHSKNLGSTPSPTIFWWNTYTPKFKHSHIALEKGSFQQENNLPIIMAFRGVFCEIQGPYGILSNLPRLLSPDAPCVVYIPIH